MSAEDSEQKSGDDSELTISLDPAAGHLSLDDDTDEQQNQVLEQLRYVAAIVGQPFTAILDVYQMEKQIDPDATINDVLQTEFIQTIYQNITNGRLPCNYSTWHPFAPQKITYANYCECPVIALAAGNKQNAIHLAFEMQHCMNRASSMHHNILLDWLHAEKPFTQYKKSKMLTVKLNYILGYQHDRRSKKEHITQFVEQLFCTACHSGLLYEAQWLKDNYTAISLLPNANNAFIAACAGGHLSVAQWLCTEYPDTNARIRDERAFCAACAGGHEDVARWIYQKWPKTYAHIHHNEPLRTACMGKNLSLVKWLLTLPHVHVRSHKHLAVYNACVAGNTELVKLLCTGKNLITMTDLRHRSYQTAYRMGHWEIVAYFLEHFQLWTQNPINYYDIRQTKCKYHREFDSPGYWKMVRGWITGEINKFTLSHATSVSQMYDRPPDGKRVYYGWTVGRMKNYALQVIVANNDTELQWLINTWPNIMGRCAVDLKEYAEKIDRKKIAEILQRLSEAPLTDVPLIADDAPIDR